jgi:L-ascorbate metabolism protein UlaG (beta-lactamase superfamily)
LLRAALAAAALAGAPAAAQQYDLDPEPGADDPTRAIETRPDAPDPDRFVNPPDPNDQGDVWPTANGAIGVRPIQHASFLLTTPDALVLVDPAQPPEAYGRFPQTDAILITGPGDGHYAPSTLEGLAEKEPFIIAPPEVRERMPEALRKLTEAVPKGDRIAYGGVMFIHLQDGPGWVLRVDQRRIYIAGQAGEAPTGLDDIFIAFLPIQPPKSMTVERAAEAATALSPEVVYPYMYRDQDPLAFGDMVRHASDDIHVAKGAWYH